MEVAHGGGEERVEGISKKNREKRDELQDKEVGILPIPCTRVRVARIDVQVRSRPSSNQFLGEGRE